MANDTGGTRRAPLSGAIYLTAILLIAFSVTNFVLAVVPVRVGDADWRYGAVGIVSGFILTPLLGCLIGVGFAVYQGQPKAARAFGIITLVIAVVLVLGLISFPLDALQFRREATEEARKISDIGVIRSVLKHLAAVVAFAMIGVGGLRMPRRSLRTRGDEPELIVGRGR